VSQFPVPPWALFRIAERDHWTCHICQLGYIPNDPWEIDHDRPLVKGGTHHVKNLRLSHRSCNRDKAAA
jgi:5-methylcytosine-specific restriction endonuclease McrA